MITTEQAVNATRMQEVRGLFEKIQQQLTYFQGSEHNQTINKRSIVINLEQYLLAKDGLESLVITHLQLTGRVIGRENFMRHLIEDFSRLLEMTTGETKTNIFTQIAFSVSDTQQQINRIGIIIIIAIVLMFSILIFIQQRILRRLKHVNLMVQNKTQGLDYDGIIKGNDEITDLAEAFNEFAETIEQQQEKLEQMSMTDGLTNIANRRALDLRLQHDIELSVRQKSSVVVLLIDIDYFKLFNDNYGHSAGDECLKLVAHTLSNTLQRDSDFVARYGGEEFVCILPNTNWAGAQEIVKRIFDELYTINIQHKYSEIADRITISMGIAISDPQQVLMPETIIKRADKALYAAKHAGKNAHKMYSPDM
jgi:diguanylate cyclase (GGDEF)-like protein